MRLLSAKRRNQRAANPNTRAHTHCVYYKHMYTHHANPWAHTFCYFINVFGVMLCLCVLRLCPTGSLHVGQCWRRLPAFVSHSLTVKHMLRSCNNPGGARHHIRTHLHVKVACPRHHTSERTPAHNRTAHRDPDQTTTVEQQPHRQRLHRHPHPATRM